jgi:hypothetical protein
MTGMLGHPVAENPIDRMFDAQGRSGSAGGIANHRPRRNLHRVSDRD